MFNLRGAEARPQRGGLRGDAPRPHERQHPDAYVPTGSLRPTLGMIVNLKYPENMEVVAAVRRRSAAADCAILLADANEFVEREDAYERLLLEVLKGDQTLFTRSDEVDRLWEVCQPLLDNPPTPQPYEKGSWGPQAALDLPRGGWRLGSEQSEKDGGDSAGGVS